MATKPPFGSTSLPVPATSPQMIVREVMTRSYSRSALFHASARQLRNRLLVATALTLLFAGGLAAIQTVLPNVPIVGVPKNVHGLARWELTLLIMFFGSLGALVSAIPVLASSKDASTPYNYTVAQGVLKIAFGSLTAVTGVILVSNSGVTNGFRSFQLLVAAAIVFGAGQQAVTRILDERANKLSASSSNPSL